MADPDSGVEPVAEKPIFGIFDYLIFAVAVLGSLGIGVYYAFANKTTDEYFLGNRKLRVVPVGLSLLVTFLSAITILGKPAEMFYYGAEYWFYSIGFFLGSFITCYTFVPLFHPLKMTSINEYILRRYKKPSMVYFCSLTQMTISVIVGGIVLYGPATMMENFSGFPVWLSMLSTALIATIYTSIGGFKAVIWSDVFQAVGILIGLLAVVILGAIKVGGLGEAFRIYASEGRGHLSIDVALTVRSTVWSYIIGSGLGALSMFGVTQAAVQRYSALPTIAAARRTLLVAVPGNFILSSLACISGVVAFAYYTKLGCDPLRAGIISNSNQIIPQFIKDVLHIPSIPGLFAACIFCGTVSTLSSSYNSGTALIWQDFLENPLKKYHLSEGRKSVATKILTVLLGFVYTASGFAVASMGGTLIQMVMIVTGVLVTPLFALVFLGAISPRTSWKSASLAALISFLAVVYIATGSVLYGSNKKPLPTVTYNCPSKNSNTTFDFPPYGNLSTVNSIVDSVTKGTLRYYYLTDSEENSLEETPKLMNETFILFRISHTWYFSIGFVISTILGCTLMFIPGLKEENDVDMSLIFPYMRRFFYEKGYELNEEQRKNLFVKSEDFKENMNFEITVLKK